MWVMMQDKKQLIKASQIYKNDNNIIGEDDNTCNMRLGEYDTEAQAQLVLRLIAEHIKAGKMFFEMPTIEELVKGVQIDESN